MQRSVVQTRLEAWTIYFFPRLTTSAQRSNANPHDLIVLPPCSSAVRLPRCGHGHEHEHPLAHVTLRNHERVAISPVGPMDTASVFGTEDSGFESRAGPRRRGQSAPLWPNGQGVSLLRRRLWVRVPPRAGTRASSTSCMRVDARSLAALYFVPLAQWTRRLPPEQEIPGSSPGRDCTARRR